jgi:hypothetical protein
MVQPLPGMAVPQPLPVRPLPGVMPQPIPTVPLPGVMPTPLRPLPAPLPPGVRPGADLAPGIERLPPGEAEKALYDQGVEDGQALVPGTDFGPTAPEVVTTDMEDYRKLEAEPNGISLPPGVPGVTAPLPAVPPLVVEKEEEKDNTALYVGLAIAGVVIAGGAFWYFTKKG